MEHLQFSRCMSLDPLSCVPVYCSWWLQVDHLEGTHMPMLSKPPTTTQFSETQKCRQLKSNPDHSSSQIWGCMKSSANYSARLILQDSFGWNSSQMSSSEDHLATPLVPGFCQNTPQMSSFEDPLARPLLPGFGRTTRQMSSFEDRLEKQLLPNYCSNSGQMSGFGDDLARPLLPGQDISSVALVERPLAPSSCPH